MAKPHNQAQGGGLTKCQCLSNVPQLVAVFWEAMGPLETWVQMEEVCVIVGGYS